MTRAAKLLMPIVTAAIVLIGTSGAAAATSSAPGPEYGLTEVSEKSIPPRTVQLEFNTAALSGTTPVTVLLPMNYSTSKQRYPVLYLLDGCCNTYNTWIDQEHTDALTQNLPLIVVMAAQGEVGLFTNWYNNGAFGRPEWETYYVDQLMPWIDAHLRTTGAQRGRALAGMSMGGFGAMSLAAKHPDMFAGAASFSGLVNVNDAGGWPLADLLPPADGGRPGDIFGPHATEAIREMGANPWNLATNLGALTLVIRTGNGMPGGPLGYGSGIPGFDPIEADVAQQSLEFHNQLDALGIPNVYDDYGPGNHSAPYWQRDLQQTLPELTAALAHPHGLAAVTYTSIQPNYSVYGWTVDLIRPVLEFSTLTHATPRGFALTGSGSATVTTPPAYLPGSRHMVKVTHGGATTSQVLRATAGGRLRIEVVLGPANSYQAATPQAQVVGTHVYETSVAIGRARG